MRRSIAQQPILAIVIDHVISPLSISDYSRTARSLLFSSSIGRHSMQVYSSLLATREIHVQVVNLSGSLDGFR